MDSAGTLVALVGAAVLLWAALEKIRDPRLITSALHQLGFGALAPLAAVLLIVVELAVGVALVLRPDLRATQVGVVVLAGAFALAGVVALRRELPIPCGCLGSASSGELGVNQLLAFVAWIGGVALISRSDTSALSPSERIDLLAIVVVSIAALRVVTIFDGWRQARGDRVSARETYTWLRR